MKNVVRLFILLIALLAFPTFILASGSVSVSTTSITLTEGETKTFNIVSNNATGRIDISTSNSLVAGISDVSVWIEKNTKTITVTANSEGTATITVNLYDVSTEDEEPVRIFGTYQIYVTVNKKPSGNTTPVTPPNNNPTPTPKPDDNPKTTNKSSNANIKTITVTGYSLTKEDNIYTLKVNNSVEKIKLSAEAEDSKAKVDGIGEKSLKVGENTFEIVVTAEDGTKKTYKVKITRKDSKYYLSDLDDAITDNEKDIIILDEKVKESDLLKIKNLKNIMNFNYYDEDNNLLYSYIIDGSKLNNPSEFSTKINFIKDDDIDKTTNYAEGINIKLDKLPDGIKIKLYVGDKYKDSEKVNIYSYDANKNLKLVDTLEVKDNYIEFDADNSAYFISKTVLNKPEASYNNNYTLLFIVVSCVEFIIIIIFIAFLMKKRNKIA